MKIIKMAFCTLFSILGMFSGSIYAMGLYDVYQLALETDPVYQVAYHQKQASSEVYQQARALLLPQVSFTADRTQTGQNIISADNAVFAQGKSNFPVTNITFLLTQPIFNYSSWAEFRKAKIEVKRLAMEFEDLQQDLKLRVAERYFAVLAANESANYIQAEKVSVARQLELTKAKHEDGLVRITDLSDAQARFLQTQAREIAIQNSVNDSLLGLKEILGQLPDYLSTLVDNIPLTRPDPEDPKVWVMSALEHNPKILIRKFAIQEAAEEINRQQAGHFPIVNLSASANKRDTEGTLFGGGSEVDTTELKIEVTIPLFAGGAVSSRARQAIELHSKSLVELRLALRLVERDTLIAYDGIINSIAKVKALEKLVEANEGLVQAKSTAYESGLTSNLEVLDAERDLFFARSEYALARYEYIKNILGLKRAAGILSDRDIQEINLLYLTESKQLPLIYSTYTTSAIIPAKFQKQDLLTDEVVQDKKPEQIVAHNEEHQSFEGIIGTDIVEQPVKEEIKPNEGSVVEVEESAKDTETFEAEIDDTANLIAKLFGESEKSNQSADKPEEPKIESSKEKIFSLEQLSPLLSNVKGRSWLRQQSGKSYVLQLTSSPAINHIEKLLKDQSGLGGILSGHTNYTPSGKPRYLLFYGVYPDSTTASNAVKSLPPSIQSMKPWPRTIDNIMKDLDNLVARG